MELPLCVLHQFLVDGLIRGQLPKFLRLIQYEFLLSDSGVEFVQGLGLLACGQFVQRIGNIVILLSVGVASTPQLFRFPASAP